MNLDSVCQIDWVAVGTWVLAGATLWVANLTRQLVQTTRTAMTQQAEDARAALTTHSADVQAAMRQQSDDLRTDLRVRLHMMLEEKWDSAQMAVHRAALAGRLLDKAPHDEITEPVPDFFESLAFLYSLDLIHRELVWNTFSFYATRW